MAFFDYKPLNQQIGQLFAAFPGDRRRQHARVHTVKIASGRQNIGHPTGRRPGRSRFNKPPAQSSQRIIYFLDRQRQIALQRAAQIFQHLI